MPSNSKTWHNCFLKPVMATPEAFAESGSTALKTLIVQDTLVSRAFKEVEFDSFRLHAGSNSFTLSPKWIGATGAIGINTAGWLK